MTADDFAELLREKIEQTTDWQIEETPGTFYSDPENKMGFMVREDGGQEFIVRIERRG